MFILISRIYQQPDSLCFLENILGKLFNNLSNKAGKNWRIDYKGEEEEDFKPENTFLK